MRRLSPSFTPALAVAVTVALAMRPAVAAVAPTVSFDQMAQAWMGAVALLAHDGGDHDRGEHDRGGRGPGDRAVAGPRVGSEGARAMSATLDAILTRLQRIEAKLDGRAGGRPPLEMRGPQPPAGRPGPRPERPDLPEHVRRRMEERMRMAREGMSDEARARFDERMQASRERMRAAGPRAEGRLEIPEEVREQVRKQLEEGRERMAQARQAFRQMEERIKKLEAEIERLKKDR